MRKENKYTIRQFLIFSAILLFPAGVYFIWSPCEKINDGRHDLRTNGIWLQHGWLGDDSWFSENQKDKTLFRNDQKIKELNNLLTRHGVRYIFPHLCPCYPNGEIPMVDKTQTERFIINLKEFFILPWVGGILNVQCFPESKQWRINFISSINDLLREYPDFAGVHLNIEPLPSGNPDFLKLLDEMREAIPKGKIISIAAFPPPTFWHPFPDVHWDETYYKEISQRVDQIVPMMYDTAIKFKKPYQYLMSCWTRDILNWSKNTKVLLGVPAYKDNGVAYHSHKVEDLKNAIMGIHAGLVKFNKLPSNYAGIAIYSEWEMDNAEWDLLDKEFGKGR